MSKKQRPDDDTELFARTMETLGVKPRPEVAAKDRKGGPAMPRVRDDAIDFDALMRESKGPATLEEAPRPERPIEVGAREVDRAAGTMAAPSTARVVRRHEASAEELALFEAAMREQVVPSLTGDEPATATARAKPDETLAKRLARPAFEVSAQLDLHGRTRAEAEPKVRAFLDECARERWEVVAIVCGRGLHSEGHRPVLKPSIERLLRVELRERVVEMADAPGWLGGSGTLLVRVRLDPGR